MIHYDPHRWRDHFFDIRGSLVKEISVRVLVCVVWSAVVVVIHRYVVNVSIPSILHSLVGLALGLLLVFRTNVSYDRYWEGRKLWGGIVNETRNLIAAASVHLAAHPDLLQDLAKWVAAFPWTAMNSLRGTRGLGPLEAELPAERVREIYAAQHPALFVAVRITENLHQARQRGVITDVTEAALDRNTQLLIDYLGGCERIRKTPLPFAYVVHLRRALIIYCLTLPFALVETFGWTTVLDVLFLAYTFLGIEEIGVEIEGPFGHDDNDLPLEEICTTIHHNVFALAGLNGVGQERLPDGL